MFLDAKVLDTTEERIKQYFESLHEIGRLKYKLEVLDRRKEKIKNDIDNSNINFNADYMGSIDYTKDKIQTSNYGSYQENALEAGFKRLENELYKTKEEITYIENRILQIEYENSDIEYILHNLNEKHKAFVEAKYKSKKNLATISRDLYVARSSIYEIQKEVLRTVETYLAY